jgi:hypothetical protein
VDSAGAQLNNTGFRAPRGVQFLDWIAKYKFMICLENSDAAGYVTEKALQASLAGTVPIYDGCGLTQFNRDAIVDASAPGFLDELKALDADAAEYQRRQHLDLYLRRPSLLDFETRFAALLLS